MNEADLSCYGQGANAARDMQNRSSSGAVSTRPQRYMLDHNLMASRRYWITLHAATVSHSLMDPARDDPSAELGLQRRFVQHYV